MRISPDSNIPRMPQLKDGDKGVAAIADDGAAVGLETTHPATSAARSSISCGCTVAVLNCTAIE